MKEQEITQNKDSSPEALDSKLEGEEHSVLRHAPLIPAGMETFHWNPLESTGMAPESAGMAPESTGMAPESAGMAPESTGMN